MVADDVLIIISGWLSTVPVGLSGYCLGGNGGGDTPPVGVPNTGDVTLRFRKGRGGGESAALYNELLNKEFEGDEEEDEGVC